MVNKGALTRGPSNPTPQLQRLSPGVYRGPGGALVNQQGRALPQMQHQAVNAPPQMRPQGPMRPSGPLPYMPGNDAAAAAGAAAGGLAGFGNKPYNFPQGATPGWMDPNNFPQGQSPDWTNHRNIDPGFGMDYRRGGMSQEDMFNQFGPQASANHGGQYRLSPGIYGTREQAMNQFNRDMQASTQPWNGVPGTNMRPGNMPGDNYARNQISAEWDLTKDKLDPRNAFNPGQQYHSISNRVRRMF